MHLLFYVYYLFVPYVFICIVYGFFPYLPMLLQAYAELTAAHGALESELKEPHLNSSAPHPTIPVYTTTTLHPPPQPQTVSPPPPPVLHLFMFLQAYAELTASHEALESDLKELQMSTAVSANQPANGLAQQQEAAQQFFARLDALEGAHQ